MNTSTNGKIGLQFIKPGTSFDFVSKQKYGVMISLALIIISIVSLIAHKGPKYGVDFAGGTQMIVEFSNNISTGDVRSILKEYGINSAVVQKFGDSTKHQFQIMINSIKGEANNSIKKLSDKLSKSKATILSIEMVGPKVSNELRTKALLAIFYSLLFITVYISGRFELKWIESGLISGALITAVYFLSILNVSIPYLILTALIISLGIFWYLDFRYAIGAIVALIHDVIITVGVFSILGIEFNLSIVAALLTIIGYSLNDTIIVFDRIRENIKNATQTDTLTSIINKSINETLSRTILTSLTTLIAIIALFVLGGGIIHAFSFAMLVGVFVGTYSSIFIASTLLIAWKK